MSVQYDAIAANHDGAWAREARVQAAGGPQVDTQAARAQAAKLGLSEAEQRILAALSRRPLGLYPAASVAIAASTGRNETVTALERLVELGLVTGDPEPVLARSVRREVVWRLDVAAAWSQVPDVLRFTELPEVPPAPMPDCLPERFAHLFWWGDTSLYKLPRYADFVAEQILTNGDVASVGWALFTLPCEALESVAGKPHVREHCRQLIFNTLAQRRGEPV